MTDKEKIKEQANIDISNLRKAQEQGIITEFGKGKLEALEGIVDFINYLQENPCDGCTNRKGCITCENGELRETVQEEPVSVWHDSNKEQPNFASAVAIWNPKYENGEILSRCTEVYSDRIWAYIDDLLKM